MRSGVADRADLVDLDRQRHRLRAGLQTEIGAQTGALRTELAELRAEMHDGQRRLTLTLVGAMASISGITFAAAALR